MNAESGNINQVMRIGCNLIIHDLLRDRCKVCSVWLSDSWSSYFIRHAYCDNILKYLS